MATTTVKEDILGQDHNKKLLDVAIAQNLPVLLVGDTGSGKTSLVREKAVIQGADWIRFNLTGETTVDEFVGKYELEHGKTVWRDGILLQAMKKGQWLIVDEINVALPEILFVLHSLLDDDKFVVVASHEGEIVRPHKDFRFFATMNPPDEYAGTKELNKAFHSRFNMVLEVKYPSQKVEVEILTQKTGITKGNANKIADVGLGLRKAKKDDKIFYTCSTRDLLQWAALTKDLGFEEAFVVTILNKVHTEKDDIVKIYDSIVGRHLKLEKSEDHELSIEYFEREAKKIKKDRDEFEKNKIKMREEVTKDIIKTLTGSDPSRVGFSEAQMINEIV